MQESRNILTMVFGENTVSYLGRTYPTGMIACQALSIGNDVLDAILPLCRKIAPVNTLIQTQTAEKSILLAAGKAAHELFAVIGKYEPFTFMVESDSIGRLDQVFTVDACKKISAYYRTVNAGKLDEPTRERFSPAIDLIMLTPALSGLYDSLSLLQQKLGIFADRLAADDAIRTKDAYLAAFSECFPQEVHPGDGSDTWLAMNNTTVQYVAGQINGTDHMQMLKHMHFISFGGMLRADFFEGLAVGHAPKRCGICNRWFLTTDARHTKYCGNVCPDDPKGRTCRQIAALRGKEERENADDHPVKVIYTTRMNTIHTYIRRGTLTPELGEKMKRLCKDKQQRALSDVDYANGAYHAEMEQDALQREAMDLED